MLSAKIIQPDIELFGILVQEPVTTLTDVIVAIACFYAFWRLLKQGNKSKTILYLKLYFVLMGVATFLGGVLGHGFIYLLSPAWKIPGWFISMFAIMLIERSSIEYTKHIVKPILHKALLIINIIELALLMFLAARSLNFLYVEIHTVYGFLVVVFSCHLYVYSKTKDKGSKYFLYAIGILAIAMFIFNYPIVLHEWFNHHDFSHVFMTIGTLYLLKGALNLQKI